jgi:lipopolysaccharide assembly protein A
MIFFLILGVLIGAVSIIFVLQNITPVTVAFFTYQLQGSLSVILFLAIMAGMLISILILLPSFIRDEVRVNRLKKQNQDLENELAAQRAVIVNGEPLL